MCLACNPLCGGCQPPRKKMVLCEQCGHFTLIDLQVTNLPALRVCDSCGGDITVETVPVPRYCKRFNVECANPCGYRFKEMAVENRGTCQFHVALFPGQVVVGEGPVFADVT